MYTSSSRFPGSMKRQTTNRTSLIIAGATALAAIALSSVAAKAQGLNLYCSVQIEWCTAIAVGFQRDTGIKVTVTQKGAGELLAQIRAEAQNPRGDVWFGGGGPHLTAAEEDLTIQADSPLIVELAPWAQKQYADSGKRAAGAYAVAIGFGINTELLARKGLSPPTSWADLLKPAYKGEIQMATPQASATAYAVVATLVQLMGEDKAFDYMKALHANINAYARSGTGPIKAVARGETAISLSFAHDAVAERNAGFPVTYTIPSEGTGHEIGSVSIIKGARNLDAAKAFYEWALTAPAQQLGFLAAGQLQTPSNRSVPLPPGAPDLGAIKLIDYDFAKYGKAAERRRLIERWDREVGALPK
jgi:iron(III) transport system substrate-binding protein